MGYKEGTCIRLTCNYTLQTHIDHTHVRRRQLSILIKCVIESIKTGHIPSIRIDDVNVSVELLRLREDSTKLFPFQNVTSDELRIAGSESVDAHRKNSDVI